MKRRSLLQSLLAVLPVSLFGQKLKGTDARDQTIAELRSQLEQANEAVRSAHKRMEHWQQIYETGYEKGYAEAEREITQLRMQSQTDQQALAAIDQFSADGFCEELGYDLAFDEKMDARLKKAAEKLSMIYRIAHAEVRSNSCYHVHTDWRKLKQAVLEKG